MGIYESVCPANAKDMITKFGTPPFLQKINRSYPIFTANDLDSFFFLFFDNMSSLLGIIAAMMEIGNIITDCWGSYCHADPGPLGTSTMGEYLGKWEDMIFFKCMPGIAFALCFGNLWYAWMAFKLAGYEERTDVTALPYGINTAAGFLSAYSVMLPLGFQYAYSEPTAEKWAEKCWQGVATATFVGGLFEISGAWIGPFLPHWFARAALFCPLFCIGFVWLGMVPFIDVMREPIIGAIPLAMVFIGFYSNNGKGVGPFGIPYTDRFQFVFIVGIGTILMWAGCGKHMASTEELWDALEMRAERYGGKNQMGAFTSLGGFSDVDKFIGIMLPVALVSFIETMENVELASTIGDSYNMREAMIVDGLGTCIGAMFGAPLPTTVYIGHTRHKARGATAGYSILNAVVYFILLMSGLFPIIYSFVDPISVGCSLIAVGLLICQNVIEHSHPRHIPALCLGLTFVIADPWNFDIRAVDTSYCTRSTARSLGLKNMWPGGGIMCSLMLTAILCDITDSKYRRASVMCLISMLFSLFGIMHGNNVYKPDGEAMIAGTNAGEGQLTIATIDEDTKLNEGWRFVVMYTIMFVWLALHGVVQAIKPSWIPAPIAGNGWDDDSKDPTISGYKGSKSVGETAAA